MRSLALLLLLAACPKAREPKCPQPPPAPVAEVVPAAPKVPELDDEAIVSQSRAFLDAHDTADLAAFQALAGGGFVKFHRARFWDMKIFVHELPARLAHKQPPASRECKDERVYRTGSTAVYIGSCAVRVPAYGETPSSTAEGWETIVWTPEGDTWKVAHWQYQRAGLDADRENWNDVFRSSLIFKTEPNQFLTEVVRGRRPGTALDVAMGQGRNAIYLASQKWRVTGVDISDEGIRIANEAAAARKLKLETVQQDIKTYDFGTNKWDLVTLIYAGDTKLIERIKPSIRRRGLFVVEFFHKESTRGTGIGGFETGELAALFAGWKILRDEVVEDIADWGLRKTKLVRFAAQKQ